MRTVRLLCTAAIIVHCTTSAVAQHTHAGDVGKFYETWQRPNLRNSQGERTSSCCNNMDCRPILETRKNKSGQANWNNGKYPSQLEIRVQIPGTIRDEWVAVPDWIWEDNQPDPRESPDERGHACVTFSGYPICAVRSSGQ